MAENARTLVRANGFDRVIEVIQSKIEDISEEIIPRGTIDVIVSEPLGTFLLNERMLETYVIARDRFLKPDGRMFPSTCHLCVLPFYDDQLYNEQLAKTAFFDNKNFYGVDMSVLKAKAISEKLSQPIIDTYDPRKK